MEITCFVEMPRGSRNKYEYDEELGALKLDRHLFSSLVFPADYGFVETRSPTSSLSTRTSSPSA